MSLQNELGLRHPFEHPEHEGVIAIVLTGDLLAKEGDHLLRPFGLTNSQFNVLMLLKYHSDRGTINQTALGRMLVVNRSNVTGLVDRMEQAGWVERLPDPEDRRVKCVRLTDAGRRILDRAEKAYYARVEEVMGTLPAGEYVRLCRALEHIRANLTVQRKG